MAFEEGFLTRGGKHPVHRLAGVRQPQREEIDPGQLARQLDVDLAEADLRLPPADASAARTSPADPAPPAV